MSELAHGEDRDDPAGTTSLDRLSSILHPQFRPFKPLLDEFLRQPAFSTENLVDRRAPSPRFPIAEPASSPAFCERLIEGRPGDPPVRVFLINSRVVTAPRPAIVHMHGGGYISGKARHEIARLQEMAAALECVILTVDYRLAPETPFPGALEDNYAALKWLYDNADQLGVDQRRIAVMGESAGGGHAAALAIAARDRGEVPVMYQSLLAPMLDDRTGADGRALTYEGAYLWKPEDNRFGWTSLLGVPAGSVEVPAGAVPSRVEDLRGLPPTFISTGAIDLFAEENITFARRLVESGVEAELHVYPGAFHGFEVTPTALAAASSAARLVAFRCMFERGLSG